MLSYYYYMLQYKNDDSDFGDLARTLRDDKNFPKKTTSFYKILNYLDEIDISTDCLELFFKTGGYYTCYKLAHFK